MKKYDDIIDEDKLALKTHMASRNDIKRLMKKASLQTALQIFKELDKPLFTIEGIKECKDECFTSGNCSGTLLTIHKEDYLALKQRWINKQ